MNSEKIKEVITKFVLFVVSLLKQIWTELVKTNAPAPVKDYSYCPGWTGTPQGLVNLQNAGTEFCNVGLSNLFTSLYLMDVVPSDDGNCYLYIFDVVGSMYMANGKKVQVKNSPNFHQAVLKASTKACVEAARFWNPNAAGGINGLVDVQLSTGYLSVYVALNNDGITCNLRRIRTRQVNNSPKRKKAAAAPGASMAPKAAVNPAASPASAAAAAAMNQQAATNQQAAGGSMPAATAAPPVQPRNTP